MLYDVKFNALFDSKKQAVTCYLSLERRYLKLYKQFKQQENETNQIISLGYINYIKSKPSEQNINFFGDHIKEAINTIKTWTKGT